MPHQLGPVGSETSVVWLPVQGIVRVVGGSRNEDDLVGFVMPKLDVPQRLLVRDLLACHFGRGYHVVGVQQGDLVMNAIK